MPVRSSSRLLLVVVLLILSVTPVFAQYRAGIQGSVTDPSGAAVPGATVTVTSKETNQSRSATSNDSGVYSIPSLASGLYTISAERQGFQKNVIDNYRLSADQVQGVNIQLQVGQVSQTVTVSGDEVAALNTENANISGSITSEQVQKLPSFGRDVYNLVQLAPGVFGDSSRNTAGDSYQQPGNQGPGGSGGTAGIFAVENRPQVSANGGRTDSNAITLDGVSVSSVAWGGAAVITPNEDSVKEVKVSANSYDAEYGRFGGSQIQVVSQTGTNQFHGSAFFKADRPGLNAYQDFYGSDANTRTPKRNTNQFNQWGGSIGGPILKNKLFAFFAYETIRNRSTAINSGWIETPQLLQLAPSGSLAARYAAYPGMSVPASSIVNQTCAGAGLVQGVNCNAVTGGLDIGSPLTTPLGTKDPTFVNNTTPGVGNGLDGSPDIMFANVTGANIATNQQFNGRMDFNATSKDTIAFNIYWVPVTQTFPNGLRPANEFNHSAINDAMTALWNRTWSPTLLNELRVNAAGWRWNEIASNPDIPGGLPQPLFIGDSANGNNIGTVCPGCNAPGGVAGSVFDQWTYSVKDTATKVIGSHTIKFGGELTKLQFLQRAPWAARPQWGFNNYWDFLNDAPVRESGTFNPLTGVPTDVRKDERQNILGFFAQDDYKFRKNLTLNLGLRYEYFQPVHFKNGQLSIPELGTGANILTGMKMQVGNGGIYQAQKMNFGPQLGFAWSPEMFNQKMVVHGGFGLGYTSPEGAITNDVWPNIPFTNNGTSLTGAQIVYDFPTDPHQFGPYPANPNTLQTFDANNIPVSGSPTSVTGYDHNFKTPYTYHYSADVQYELGHNWVASFGYQGSSSHHLIRKENLNQVYGSQGIALNPFINNVAWYTSSANAHNNALLIDVNHRFSSQFQFSGEYRYAKSLDDQSKPQDASFYQWIPGANWGYSDFDVRHALKFYGIWSPTFFHGDRTWIEKIIGGWSLSGIANWHTGYPFNPVTGSSCDITYAGGNCQNGSNGSVMPAAYLGGAGNGGDNSNFLRAGGNFPNGGLAYFTPAFDPATFVPCALPYPQTCSNLPLPPGVLRNSFTGPRYFSLDATLSKSFGLPKIPGMGENAKFEFRANAYNLFNNTNLISVVTDIRSGSFGQATDALGGRTVELQARFSF